MLKFLPLLAVLICSSGCARTVEVSLLDPEEVLQLEIFPGRWDAPGYPPELIEVKDPVQIRAFLRALHPVGEVSRSGLIDRVKVVVMEKTGKKNLLQFQPGNDPAYYEYHGQGRAYRVDREPLLKVFDDLGAKWAPR